MRFKGSNSLNEYFLKAFKIKLEHSVHMRRWYLHFQAALWKRNSYEVFENS